MRWYKNLYIGEKARKNRYKIVWKVKHRAGTINVYLLIFPSNSENMLEILNANYLLQPYYRHQDIKIIGIASSYGEALTLLTEIVQEIYQKTGTVNIKEYIIQQQNGHTKNLWQV